MYEKVIRINSFFIVLFIVCFVIGCAGAFLLGSTFDKSGNPEYSGRDYEYRRQMGYSSELLDSIDGRIAGVQDGLGRIKTYLGQDAGDLRGLAQRLRNIASVVEEMENDLACIRSDIGNFRWFDNNTFYNELR